MWSDFPKTAGERLALLQNLRVVMVGAKFPGNLGMAARAMKNCAVTDMRLVTPRAELNKEAYQMAVDGSDILDTAVIHDGLAEAVEDCSLVIGTTRRRGVLRRNVISPEEAAAMIGSALTANKAAIVFGSEDAGLMTDDLALCHWIVGMHTGSEFESFNLAHSVAIHLYLINRAIVAAETSARKLAPAKELEYMFDDITRFLVETGFIHEKDPKRMMITIRRILHRSGLNDREVKIIHGILRQARWRIENPEAPLEPRDTPQTMKKSRKKKGSSDEKKKK
jgi:tRNA/rRNA methyltransferase